MEISWILAFFIIRPSLRTPNICIFLEIALNRYRIKSISMIFIRSLLMELKVLIAIDLIQALGLIILLQWRILKSIFLVDLITILSSKTH